VHVETQKQSFLSCVDSLMGSLNNEQTHQVHHILAAADAAGIEPHQLRKFFAYAFQPSEAGMLRLKAGRRGGISRRRGGGAGVSKNWERYEQPPVRRRRHNAPAAEELAIPAKPFCARCQILKDIRMGKRARVYKLKVIPGSTITPPPNRGQMHPTTPGASAAEQQPQYPHDVRPPAQPSSHSIEAAMIRAQHIHAEKSGEQASAEAETEADASVAEEAMASVEQGQSGERAAKHSLENS
jgi:hypothetical protein